LQVFTEHQAPVTGAAWHPDDDRVVSCSRDGMVWLWNTRSPRPPRRLDCAPFPATCVAVSPDGKHALAGGADGSLHLWEVRTRQEISRFERGESPILAVAFSPDSSRIASAGGSVEYRKDQAFPKDCVVRVWDLASGKMLHTLTGHTRPVRAVVFGRGGKTVFSGGLDRTVRLWGMKSGKQLHPFLGATSGVTSVVVVDKKEEVLAGALDGSIWGWDLPDRPARDEASP
jgi:WD40 repeat protein